MAHPGVLRYALLLLIVAGLGLMLMAPTPAVAQSSSVLRTEVRGPITPVMAGHLADAVNAAEAGEHAALIVVLDTPGGLVTSMRDIVQTFLTARVPVVVHVAPPGASAGSAGAVMTFASHVAAMAPGTNIGAATPINLQGGEVVDKVIEDAAAYVTAIAELRGRNVEFAVDTVREGRSASATEAHEIDAVDLIANEQDELLAALDGRTVVLHPDREVRLDVADATVVTFEMSTVRRLLQALANPELAFLFMSIGGLALLYELANPGAGLGGILGAIMLILGFFAMAVLPVDLVGVALLVLAAGLFIAELFAPGIGVFAGGGAIALLLAGLFLFQRPTGIGVDAGVLYPVVVVVGLGAVFVGRIAWHSRQAPAYSGQGATVVGQQGVVREVQGETAQVFVAGALWRARAQEGALAPGDRVRVAAIEGLELQVEPTSSPPQETSEPAD